MDTLLYIARRHTPSYDVVILMLPVNCWRNSTPFWCKASLWELKLAILGNLNSSSDQKRLLSQETRSPKENHRDPRRPKENQRDSRRSKETQRDPNIFMNGHTHLISTSYLFKLSSFWGYIHFWHCLSFGGHLPIYRLIFFLEAIYFWIQTYFNTILHLKSSSFLRLFFRFEFIFI